MNSRISALLTFITIAVCGTAVLWWLWTGSTADVDNAADAVAAAEGSDDADAAADVVVLPEPKAAALSLQVATAERRRLQPTSVVPARLQYDDRRHVEVRVATPGILTDVLVKPGDHVAPGQVLAILSSPEVGHARADVMQSEADLRLAQEKLQWEQTTFDGLTALAAAIHDRKEADQIREQFRDVSLGSVRQTLLTAYSELLLAEQMADAISDDGARGALSARVVRERLSERDTTAAKLSALLEQSKFDARQQCRAAQNLVEDAQRRLDLRRQNVRTLLGSADNSAKPAANAAAETAAAVPSDASPEPLSHVEIKAPFAGTIEKRAFAPSERVAVGDAVFVLANTATLWVAADLREHEFAALKLLPGDEIRLSLPTETQTSLTARVYFVGREVDPETNAVPLIAEVDNQDGLLRPGMFTQATIPTGDAIDALCIPESAIVEHDGKAFVFVPQGERKFRKADVITGRRSDDMVEIVSGLTEGQQVLSSDAFYLKSELLLEGEE
ncbi:MAG: efflux RND transporter periplasmic adaptor subunit [Planctomycetaceae bacterium]